MTPEIVPSKPSSDAQGKVYSTALLRAELDVPDDVLASLAAGRGER